MLIAPGEHESGQRVLLIGLTAENTRRLHAGQPIILQRPQYGNAIPEGLRIMIIAGEDEQEMMLMLRMVGAAKKDTPVFEQPGGK